MRRIAVLALLLALTVAAVASAKIVVNQGMFGIKLGQSMSQVRHKLGKPSQVITFSSTTTWFYASRDLTVDFRKAPRVVDDMYTTNSKQRTANGVGIGTSEQALKRKVHGLRCHTQADAGTHCLTTTSTAGTDFHIGAHHKVDSVFITSQG
jgi:outer membrane protein assembly factor BamE (lipoprotein component of BamABCDE complex)